MNLDRSDLDSSNLDKNDSDKNNIEKTLQKLSDTALVRLVYVSSATLKTRLDRYIAEHIESHAVVYNKQHGITGILCYGNGQFLQCIEGSKVEIVALMQKIRADKRHDDIEIPLLQPIDQRMFDDWRMRLLFLERWSWSASTKSQANSLSPYLPFTPHNWSAERHEQFLETIKTFAASPSIHAAGITYNALVNMFRHIASPHQAFLVVQGFLAILLILALYLINF